MRFKGTFLVECFNADGTLAWRENIKNGPTLAGLNYVMSVAFGAGAQLANWYVGLIDAAGFTALATGDTMSSHAGWVEATQYSEGTRRAWGGLNISNGVANNPGPLAFTMSAGKTLQGLFLASDSAKGGTAGTLWATALFATPRVMSGGQVLTVIYVNQATGGS